MTEKSLDHLIELIKVYGAELNGADVKGKSIIYYLNIKKEDMGMSVDATMVNLYQIFKMFTCGDTDNTDIKIDLKYQLV